jgi:hypothetical protein
MPKNKFETIIYWAPGNFASEVYDLNHLYPEVKSLYEECLGKKANLKDNDNNFLMCPAFSDLTKNTFVHRSSVDTHARLDFVRKRVTYPTANQLDQNIYKVPLNFKHLPSLEGHNLIQYTWPILFFSEEDSMMATLTAPYFERTISQNYGVVVPGRFDIGKWFRNMNAEFQLWPGVNELNIPANEALFYVHFETDKQIVFKRFIMTRELERLRASIVSVSPFKRFARLSERYKVFERSQSKQRIIKLIKKQLVVD